MLAWTCVSPPTVSAQLGRLIVAVTSPSSGSTIFGGITITASVTIVGTLTVAGVQFQVDGQDLGSEDRTAPYSATWNTMTVSNGSHTVTAVARDLLGVHWTSDPVTVTVSNDTTPPTVAITSPPSGATVNGTLAVTADAADDVGVAGVQFFLDGATLGAEDRTAPYSVDWDTTTVANDSHVLAAVARDAAGHTTISAAVNVAVNNAPVPSGATRLEDTEPSIVYTPGTANTGRPPDWWHGSRSREWSNRTASVNRSSGGRATLTFTGTAVSWIGFRAPWAGIARAFVDGAFVTEVDLYATTEQPAIPVFSASGLAPGSHTVAIESTGRKHGGDVCAGPDCATDYAVFVDAFDVGPSFPPPTTGTRAEETAASVSYTGAWSQDDRGNAWSGGTAVTAASGGARAAFSFVGTSVSWIGLRGPDTGIARVYLDGSFQALVNTYSATEIQAVVYTASSLAPARHTVTIEATGSKDAAASDTRVVLDAFDTQSRFEDPDPAIAYAGSWIKENVARTWSGTSANTGNGTAALSATGGDHAEITFTGTGVSWIGFRSPLAGIASVSLDGASAGQVDLYAPTESVQVPVFVATGLSDGTHTLRIDVTGQRNPSATGGYVVIDAIDVILSDSLPAVTRVQENDPSITYTGPTDWNAGSRYKYFSGEFGSGAATVGAQASIRFTGTFIRWIGQRRAAGAPSTGVARVYLDGNLVGQIDTRSSLQEEDQAAIFTASGLSPGSHTLTLEVVGRNGEPPGTPAETIVVDAFDLIP